METRAPDLALHFHSNPASGADKSKPEEDVVADDAELEQLADRVSAARSVY